MAQTLEEFQAQAAQAYLPTQNAIQTQLSGLDSQYATEQQKINRNYDQLQADLENQRNQAAEAASLSAQSFGGGSNLARRKYYEKTFVPAQAQLQTNKSNDLDTLRQNIENQRASLNSQLANLQAQGQQQALQQFWAQQEAERNRAAQLAAAKASNPYQYMDDGYGTQGSQLGNKVWDFGDGYTLIQGNDGRSYYKKDGNQISAASFLYGTANNGNKWNLWNDVWNNGVSTYGIGSDTIDAFGRGRLNAKALSNYVDLVRI